MALLRSFRKERKSKSLFFALFEKSERVKSERAKERLPNPVVYAVLWSRKFFDRIRIRLIRPDPCKKVNIFLKSVVRFYDFYIIRTAGR